MSNESTTPQTATEVEAEPPAPSKPRKRRMDREAGSDEPAGNTQPKPVPQQAAKPERAPNKISAFVALLKAPGGASLAELVAATGWLPHTTRAGLTGLKKKGHSVHKTKVDGVTRYSIKEAGE